MICWINNARCKHRRTSIHLALSDFAGKYRVPIGLEAASEDAQNQTKGYLLTSKRYRRDVLMSVLKVDDRYDWSILDGVINVFPEERRDRLVKDILDTR